MAVLGRNNWISQQRVDLSDLLAMESYIAADFRAIVSLFSGLDKAYVVRGFEVVGKTGLAIEIKVSDSMALNPKDGNGSFYIGLSSDSNVILTLPANQNNIYVEAVFSNQTEAPVNRGNWDPLAQSGDDASGAEYTASSDFQSVIFLSISANTVGFSEGAIPLLKAKTSASAITEMKDSRNLLLRLGTGGANPNPSNKFGWANTRSEPVQSGTGVGDASDSPWRSKDSTGVLNDKAFQSVKDLIDAVLTRISEIAGTSLWYAPATPPSSPVSNISLYELFFDTIGSNIQPSSQNAFKWETVSGNLTLTGEGSVPLTSGTYHSGLIRWKSNYSGMEWHLGATFVGGGSTFRNYSAVRFQAPAPVDGGNVYLKLEREVVKGSGADLSWKPATAPGGINPARAVTGAVGDFTGIALGDYIRKESEGYGNYYKVVKMWDGTTLYDNTVAAHENRLADSNVIAVELESLKDPSSDINFSTTESLKFFRSRYSDSDLYADQTADVFNYQDANFYWLGRRVGSLFILRDYGTMQEGEEVTTLDSVYAQGSHGGLSGLMIEHAYDAIYNSGSGYKLTSGATTTLLTLRRYKRDNTASTPTSSDNSGAMLLYTINAPVGLLSVGDSLWVRLSDAAGGVLSAGSVTNTTDDDNNTDTTTNVYEVRSEANTPVRSFDNKDIFWIAKRLLINGNDCLLFADGSVLNGYGNYVNNHMEVQGEFKLSGRPTEAVLFMNKTIAGQVDTDATYFFYDKTVPRLEITNIRFENNRIYQATPGDVDLFDNLGAHTATIGDASSTIRIPGNFIVEGDYTAENIAQLQVDDKVITLGVGDALNGGYGGGIEVADDTKTAASVDSYNAQIYVDLTYSSAHGYVLGDVIGVNATQDVGGITAGQMGGQYTVVSSGSTSGDAEVISSTVLRIWTSGTATSTTTSSTTPPRTFKAPWSIRVGSASGAYTGITSWVFAVKGQSTTPAVTPVSGYGIVPTAHSTLMLATRIPFVNDDNSGPAGADTTLSFTPNFTWDNSTNTLGVVGTISLTGSFLPGVDDTYNLGENSSPLRWHAIYLGQSAGSGIMAGPAASSVNLYWSSANHWKTDDELEVALTAFFDKETTYTSYLIATYPNAPASGKVSVFAQNDLTWQRSSDGDIRLLTNIDGNVYEEQVDVVSSPSGNNQMAAVGSLSLPYLLTIPKDRRHLVGRNLTATTVSIGSPLVNITKTSHGLTTGELITVTTTTAIGGISAGNLSVSSVAVTVLDANTLQYTASANATSVASGSLDLVTAVTTRKYTVGSGELEVYINGKYLRAGTDWTEVGLTNSLSNQINLNHTLVLGDEIKYRIDANSGQYIINMNSGITLQSAYAAGNSITISSGVPLTINGPASQKLLVVNGDIDVTGIIDPKALTFDVQVSDPLIATDLGLWVNSAGNLIFNRGTYGSAVNLSSPSGALATNSNDGAITSTEFEQFTAVKTSAYSAVKGDKVLTDSTGGSFTITLPAGASVNDKVEVWDYAGTWSTNPITINPGANSINGVTGSRVFTGVRARLRFTFTATGWTLHQISTPKTYTPIKTSAYTAVAGDRVKTDSSGGAFSVTLPASPSINDEVELLDVPGSWASNNVTLLRNGSNINGVAADFTLNMSGEKVVAVYVNSTYGWRIQ